MARIELFNNNGHLASVKPKQQQRHAKLNGLYWAFKNYKTTESVLNLFLS